MRLLPAIIGLTCCSLSPPPPGVWVEGELFVGRDLPEPRRGVARITDDGLEIHDKAPPNVRPLVVDRVTAGFVDAHAHPVGLGRKLRELDVQGLPSYASTLEAVRARASGEGWLQGRGWDHNRWSDAPEGGWPRAADLDAIVPDRPVVLRRVDGHASWVNSAALRAAGIDATTPDPPGGRIHRDETGTPTGILIDTAAALVPAPSPSVDQIEQWILEAQRAMLAAGLVGAHDMGASDDAISAYRNLIAAELLDITIWAFVDPDSREAQALLKNGPTDEGPLKIIGIKAYADGALGSRGAHLLAPYSDEPTSHGLRLIEPEALRELAIRCLRAKAQLAVHAIGDAAAREVLDAFEAARREVPEGAGVPFRLEHAQVVSAQDRARLARLRVVASVQPTHATSDHPWAPDRLGPDRVPDSYAWRELLNAGAPMVLGSDFPVESHDPALGLWAATTRTDPSGEPDGGWRPDQTLTLSEAIAGFTTWAGRYVGERPARCLDVGCAPSVTLWRRLDGAPGWQAAGVVLGQDVLMAESFRTP